jgi:AraC family transcriptional regulator
MQPRIEHLREKKLIGAFLRMNMINNRTGELWSKFMPRIKEIKQKISKEMISLQYFDPLYFSEFNPAREFEKWAVVEVQNQKEIPNGMEALTLKAGLYAVFNYKGSSSDNSIFQYIYQTWLPNSKYHLDNRPHFEVLGVNYKNNDPDSEEEIWIPIKNK